MRTGASWESIHFKYIRLVCVYLMFARKPTLFKALLVDGGGEVVDGGGEVVDGGLEVVYGGAEVVIGQVALTVWKQKSSS